MGAVCCASSEDRAKWEADGTSEPKLMFDSAVQTSPLPSEMPVVKQEECAPPSPEARPVEEPPCVEQANDQGGIKNDQQDNSSGLTQDDIDAVQSTWVLAARLGVEKVGVLLFKCIFELAPEAKQLFSFPEDDDSDLFESEKLIRHATKVVGTVSVAVVGLTDLDQLVPVLQDLGRRHVQYGVKAPHYDIVGKALINTLKAGLGVAFTCSVEESWTKVYSLLADTMKGDNYLPPPTSGDAKKQAKAAKGDDAKKKTASSKKKADEKKKPEDESMKKAAQNAKGEKASKEKAAEEESTKDGETMETKKAALAQAWKAMSAQDKKRKGEALRTAAKDGNSIEVTSLLDEGVSPDCLNNDGWSALHFAAQEGKKEIVEILLKYGGDPTLQIKLGEWGHTPLHYAARNGYKEICQILLKADKKGKALRIKNFKGQRPSDMAKGKIASYLQKQLGEDV